MFQRTKICSGLLLAFGSTLLAVAPGAFAQDTTVQRVEITGSSIKRIDAETSEPVTVIKADDLKKRGVTSVEQILQNISAVQTSTTTSQVVGSGSAGASFADIRGIGANKTLILLNGRRIANNAFDGGAPDLNMIPFAAIERVEVLRDGASSLYGTDAIGGVINFITRSDYRGGTITLGVQSPQHPGGATHQANIGFGAGDLEKDGLNVFGFLDFDQTASISGTQRNFNLRQPGGLSPTPFPANYEQLGANGYGNPSNATGCKTGNQTPDPAQPATDCYEATSAFVNYTPYVSRVSGFAKAAFKVNADTTFSLEGFLTHSRTDSVIAPVPYGLVYQNRLRPDGSLNPYYPGNGNFTPNIPLDPAYFATGGAGTAAAAAGAKPGYVVVKFRDLPNGDREDIPVNDQARFTAALDGTLAGWDYSAGASLNINTVKDSVAGYSNANIIDAGILNGVINPFGAQSAAGTALLASAQDNGLLQSAKGTVQQVDAHASRDLADWFHAGRPAALALGVEARHEDFVDRANPPFAAQVVNSTGIDPALDNEGKRSVYAAFFELNVPILKSLETTIAGRYDKYSDFGSTFNPKFSFRFQPAKQFLLRGSFSTGFRAPTLFEEHDAQAYTNTSQEDDPVNCPGGVDIHHQGNVCAQQFQALTGGNTHLKPERAKNATLGIVLEPVNDLTLGVDAWYIQYKNQIGSLDTDTVFADATTYASLFHRNSEGLLSTDGSACPGSDCGYVSLLTSNLGKVITNGLDLSATYHANLGAFGKLNAGVQSTWVHTYEFQTSVNSAYTQNVGSYQNGSPVFRWQHNAEIDWNYDALAFGVAGHYKSGYLDQTPYNYAADGTTITSTNRVSAYATFDLFGTYTMSKGFSVTVGVKNVADRQPPFSNQVSVFQANYDPRYTDPTGRTYYARGTYSF